MRLTVLGGCGAFPGPGAACSGYLVEHDGFRLLIDPGYAVLPRLVQIIGATELDAVLVSHGHPDHCADLNPLLRARAFRDEPPRPLPVYAPPGALAAVLALDRKGMLDDHLVVHDIDPGDRFTVGPFDVRSWLLPHSLPNAGLRLTADGKALAYTGDTGPSPDLVNLAKDADLYLAEATYPRQMPADLERSLSTASLAGRTAAQAHAGRLVLTHLWPGTDHADSLAAAAEDCTADIAVAVPGLVVEV